MSQTTIFVTNELFATAESSPFSGTFELESIDAGPDTYVFAEPLSWSVVVSNTGGALLVAGTVSGNATTACARCLEDVDVAVNGEVEGYFVIDDEEAEPEGDDAEQFERLGPENTIDLAPLLEAAILVDLPLQPLCREDCAGICPDCGINLNEESCNCAAARRIADEEFEAAKNPFAKLAELDLNELSEDDL